MPEFMISLRKANGTKGVGPVQYLMFDGADGAEQTLTQKRWVAQVMGQFTPGDPSAPGAPRLTGEILFLVHGFNVDHTAARKFHITCATGLKAAGWVGQVISFDWPSDGLVFAYLEDRGSARAAASALVISGIGLLEEAQQANCGVNVHVLAHSMGGFVVQQAFTWAYQDVPAGWKVGQLIFAAADVDHAVFSASNYSAVAFGRHSGRVTAYCNRYDKALAVSNAKRLDLAPRMGRVGLPDDAPTMMCEVDCSAFFDRAYTGLFDHVSPVTTHVFYFDRPEFWRDAVLTLGGGMDRSVIPTREPDPGNAIDNRYQLKPAGISDTDYARALGQASVRPPV